MEIQTRSKGLLACQALYRLEGKSGLEVENPEVTGAPEAWWSCGFTWNIEFHLNFCVSKYNREFANSIKIIDNFEVSLKKNKKLAVNEVMGERRVFEHRRRCGFGLERRQARWNIQQR